MLAKLIGMTAALRFNGLPHDRRTAKRAFTLIELLVVVTIVIILIALLVPAVNRAREVSRASVCGASLRGIVSACTIYSQEWDDLTPYTQDAAPTSGSDDFGNVLGSNNRPYWFTGLYNGQYQSSRATLGVYLTKPNIVMCPTMSSFSMTSSAPGSVAGQIINSTGTTGTATPPLCGYYMNSESVSYYSGTRSNPIPAYVDYGSPRSSSTYGSGVLHLRNVQNLQETMYFMDSASYTSSTSKWFCAVGGISPGAKYTSSATGTGIFGSTVSPNGATIGIFHGRHYGYGNVAFMDGHVELLKPYQPQDVTTSNTQAMINARAAGAVGYLTLDPLTEPMGDTSTPGTFIYNSTQGGTTKFGLGLSIFYRDKVMYDQR